MPIMSGRRKQNFRPRHGMIVFFAAFLFLPGLVHAEQPVELIDPNSLSGAGFGSCVTAVPDVNDDGKWDVAVRSRNLLVFVDPPLSGNATIFNGATGAKLGTLFPPYNADLTRMRFAESISGVQDVNGDGCGDVIVGDPDEDVAYVYDGNHHTVLQTLQPNTTGETDFGYNVAGLPDINGDGSGDVAVGAPHERWGTSPYRAGRAYVFDGSTGTRLRLLTSPHEENEGYFGGGVAGVPDVNGDGKWDLLVASLETPDGQPAHAGRVYLFDGASTQVLRTFISPNPEEWGCFGLSITGLPDLNGDGAGEVLIGSYESPGASPAYSGRAYLFNGETGQLIHTFVSPNEMGYGEFGLSVAGVPDVNGDGRWEILIAAPWEAAGGVPDAGHVYLYDGVTFRLLRTLTSPTPQDGGGFGGSIAGLPDVNGDGRGDAVIGACGESGYVGGSYLLGVGRAYIFHLEPGPPARVNMDWTLYGSAALGFRTGRTSVREALPGQ